MTEKRDHFSRMHVAQTLQILSVSLSLSRLVMFFPKSFGLGPCPGFPGLGFSITTVLIQQELSMST